MNISKVHVELTGEDILSIINEFLKIDGLDISKVAISQEIEITGCYTNKISIDFKISVSSLQIKEGKLFGRINKINVKKLGIFRPFRSLIIKYAIKLLALNGITRQKDAFIIGAGNLGTALIKYDDLKNYGLNILALFDNDSLKVGMTINSKEVFHISKLPNLVKRLNVDIAILTVPKEVSQECADFLVNSGIKYIWNFTPRVLKVSKDVRVWNENLIGNFVQFIAEDEEANDN